MIWLNCSILLCVGPAEQKILIFISSSVCYIGHLKTHQALCVSLFRRSDKMMGTFKILSSLVLMALVGALAQDCQTTCEAQCLAFVDDVADALDCELDDSHAAITSMNCKDHCTNDCQRIVSEDCQDVCVDECHKFAADVAKDLECLADDAAEVMEFNQCDDHCESFCSEI